MTEPYKGAAAVEAAIRDAARNAFAADKSMSTQDRIRQGYSRRFLSRIFSERDDGLVPQGRNRSPRTRGIRPTVLCRRFCCRRHCPEVTARRDLNPRPLDP
jgi:hypothetical protein